MAVDESAFRRLVDLGRRDGSLTIDQIDRVLPIRSMSHADLAETIDRLERDGITVEIDETLQRPPRGGERPPELPAYNPPPDPPAPEAPPSRPRIDPATEVHSRQRPPAQPAPASASEPAGRSMPTAMIAAVVIVVALLILLFLALL